MQKIWALIGSICLLAACHEKKIIPDVAGIRVELKPEHFEQDFFALDTLHPDAALEQLNAKYPGFTKDFLYNILGSSPGNAVKDVKLFIRTYTEMYRASAARTKELSAPIAQLRRGLQFVKYYFPAYRLPGKLVLFIGPINGYGNIITPEAFAAGLQVYMGKDYPLYLSEEGQQLYPPFISRKFEPAYLPVNCIRNVIDDLYPNKSMGQPLIEQMIESGKRLYLLDRLLPELADTLKMGYTAKQLEGCYASEKNIWSFFVQNELLYSTDPNMTRDYLNDAPNTQALGEASPGNIGQFVGMQIVRKWMEKKEGRSLDALMKTPARHIFDEAKYKPR